MGVFGDIGVYCMYLLLSISANRHGILLIATAPPVGYELETGETGDRYLPALSVSMASL
jgi:hypothetical protein